MLSLLLSKVQEAEIRIGTKIRIQTLCCGTWVANHNLNRTNVYSITSILNKIQKDIENLKLHAWNTVDLEFYLCIDLTEAEKQGEHH